MSRCYFTQAQATLAAAFAVGCDTELPANNWTAEHLDKQRSAAWRPGDEFDHLPLARFVANAKEFSTPRKILMWGDHERYHWFLKCDGVAFKFETYLSPVELGFEAPLSKR